MGVPTIQREDVRFKNGGHGPKSAYARATHIGQCRRDRKAELR
jgi:hypothetical protein